MYCNINLTFFLVQLLKPGHLGEDFLSRTHNIFSKQKILKFFLQVDQ